MMFRLRSVNSCIRRLLHVGTVNRDQVLERLQVCSVEDEVFDVVGKNKDELTLNHVSCAVKTLWQLQKERPHLLRTLDHIRSHPQFLTLQVLAENEIALMSDSMLVDLLYAFLRLNVEPHASLVQRMVSEAWRRVDGLPMTSLSKLAICLSDLELYYSPLMGHITNIVDQRLLSIDDARALAALMVSVSRLVSPRLRDALISRADHLLTTTCLSSYTCPRRMVQFLRSTNCFHQPLLEKCNEVFIHNISRLDSDNISIILGMYQSLRFNSCDFTLAAKQKLAELVDSTTDPLSFCKLFSALAPMASPEIRERLEDTALLLADELSAQQALAIIETLEGIQSRNLSLLNKIASVMDRNLHVYSSMEVARMAQVLILLHYQNPELFTKIRKLLVGFLELSFTPSDVTMLTHVLSTLPCSQIDERVASRVDAVLAQCDLCELSSIAFAVAKWVRNDPSHRHNTHRTYVRLLQNLNRCGHERLQMADRLDAVLEDVKYLTGEWFEEMLLDETMVTLQRMMDQINWMNARELAAFLTRVTYHCPPLMDRVASVVTEHIDKIHHLAIYGILLPFSILNHDSVQADKLFDVCIKHFTPHISSFQPHLLVLLGYALALTDRFPEEVVREIFTVDFLGRLDSQLASLPETQNIRTRQRLMELNRAVCLECPEFQVPWFHQRYFQYLQRKGNAPFSPVKQQIHKMLAEVLGGFNYLQVQVVTPYSYAVDFECKLDKHLQPLSYSKPSTLHILNRGQVHLGTSSLENIRDELPPGAQRVAVEFIGSKLFCRNSHHIKGDGLMRKRHLEILGYRVVQIPHFEWNSMELSTYDAWKEYLKNKLFR